MAHIDYHVVLETLGTHQDRCPLCAFTAAAERSYYDSMLYSWVGTEGFQDRFLAADGFCATHAHRLGERNDGVAVAMLYAPLLQHRRRWIERKKRSRVLRLLHRVREIRNATPAHRGEYAGAAACPLCDQIALWEKQFLKNLVRHSADASIREAFFAGYGLCLPHYRLLVTSPGPVPRWIAEYQEQRLNALAQAVDDFVRGAVGGSGGRNSTVWQELLTYMEGPTRTQGRKTR